MTEAEDDANDAQEGGGGMPWLPPLELADAPPPTAGYTYDVDSFFVGEVPAKLLHLEPHRKKGAPRVTSLLVVLGIDAPANQKVRVEQYLGLDFTNDFNASQHRAFLDAFAPGYVGGPQHRSGVALDLATLKGRWALVSTKKEVDDFADRPVQNRCRVSRFLGPLAGPQAVDLAKVRIVGTALEPAAGAAPREPAPGARPPAAAPSPGSAATAPASGMPARPAPPVQQTIGPRSSSAEDFDLPT